MPKLLNRSMHEEFKSNSTLQVKDQKERRAKWEEKHHFRKNIPASTVPNPSFVRTVPPAPCFPAVARFCSFVTVFGFSPLYPCCNHLCLDCMVFHLVCKAI